MLTGRAAGDAANILEVRSTMPLHLIVVEKLKDFRWADPGGRVVTVDDYVGQQRSGSALRARVVNLCRDFGYLSLGYYCSLLAEARGARVVPRVRTILDLDRRTSYQSRLAELDRLLTTFFLTALETYTERRWHRPRLPTTARYDLAVLVDPNDKMPPSKPATLRHLAALGPSVGVQVELIERKDLPRLAVPSDVLNSAVIAGRLVGRGLYGVDLKVTARGAVVIEVNDNLNLDHGLGDKAAGDDVLISLLRRFVTLIEARHEAPEQARAA